MSKKKLQEKVKELVSLREMAAELADEIEALTDEIKADMDRQGVDTLAAGKHTIRWAVVKSSRFDSRAFREMCIRDRHLGSHLWINALSVHVQG